MQKQNREEKIAQSYLIIKKYYQENGKLPTATEYDIIHGDGYSRRRLSQFTNKTWNETLDYLFPDVAKCKNTYTNVDDVKRQFVSFLSTFDGMPTYQDFKKAKLPTYRVIQRLFGMTYLQFVKSLGYEMRGTTTEQLENEVMLKQFKEYYDVTGKLISHNNRVEGCKSFANYEKKFGSMENVCKLADVPYETISLNNGAFGIYCRDKQGNFCNSVVESQIDNYFIDNNIPFEKEYKYSHLIPKCRFIFDWKICVNSRNYYIEYVGLYSEKSAYKLIQKYTQKVKNKIQLLKNHNLWEQCVFIYPTDIKHKSYEEIFSFTKQ